MTKNQIQGLVVTIVAHALVVLLLLMVKLSAPLQEEESGIPVMLG